MIGSNRQLSFAAGSTSLDPYGYRVIDSSSGQRMVQLVRVFPELSRFLNPGSLIISAYPAALGLQGMAPVVDTYLHPPTFIRAAHLAAIELRPVVMVAQPLAGADLLMRLLASGNPLPKQILWASGGYYLPRSLEEFIAWKLAEQRCSIKFLHSYGVAEVGHTIFAATQRFASGLPKYRQIAREVTVELDGSDNYLVLQRGGKRLNTGDMAHLIGNSWAIESGRTSEKSVSEIESWSPHQWERRTGYFQTVDQHRIFQLRDRVEATNDDIQDNELPYHLYWHRFGGSFSTKPRWDRCSNGKQSENNQACHFLKGTVPSPG